MEDPVSRAKAIVEALEQGDRTTLGAFVPERFREWLEDYLRQPNGWAAVEELAGAPRRLKRARALNPTMARLVYEGSKGEGVFTITFDEEGLLRGFAMDPEEYEGIGTIVVSCPLGRSAELSMLYLGLLGHDVRQRPRLNVAEVDDYLPPRWPDPAYPQQLHLDINVRDLNASHERVVASGATLLDEQATHRTYADPVGHPFCLYPASRKGLRRVVIDCADAAELGAFYEALLGPEPVPSLGFQEVADYRAPRWPDPSFPAQMHFDVKVDDRSEVETRIGSLGATRAQARGGSCPVYVDPAGHPFCLCLHGE